MVRKKRPFDKVGGKDLTVAFLRFSLLTGEREASSDGIFLLGIPTVPLKPIIFWGGSHLRGYEDRGLMLCVMMCVLGSRNKFLRADVAMREYVLPRPIADHPNTESHAYELLEYVQYPLLLEISF